MGDKSKIEWTDATWNPVVGCTRVSAGCDHCYAFQLHDTRHVAWKRGRMPTAPPQYHVPFSTVQTFPARLDQPLRWRRPRRIFVNSLSDLFHDAVPDEFIDRVFGVMGRAKWHTFQILTKRPKRMAEYVASPGRSERVCAAADAMPGGLSGAICQGFWPLPNVWLGVSVEDQRAADERIPLLLETPAAVRFLSCEPLLGPVDLKGYLPFQVELPPRPDRYFGWRRGIDWVIVGGESGPHARPMHPEWARSLRDQCAEANRWVPQVPGAAGVSFHFKQVGGRTAKAGGRELDGREWNEFPSVVGGA